MIDLYAALGLDKSASKTEIRKAYRKKAKAAHPDTGGSREQFAIVSLAASVLGDDTRRARYDQTGEAEPAGPDTLESQARQCAFQAIGAVMAEAERRGMRIESIDLIADAITTLNNKLEEIAKAESQAKADLFKLKKLVKRFGVKKGKPDIIGPMMASRVLAFEDNVRTSAKDRPAVQRAREILKDHTFDVAAETYAGGPFVQTIPLKWFHENATA